MRTPRVPLPRDVYIMADEDILSHHDRAADVRARDACWLLRWCGARAPRPATPLPPSTTRRRGCRRGGGKHAQRTPPSSSCLLPSKAANRRRGVAVVVQ